MLSLQLYFCNPVALGLWQGCKLPAKLPGLMILLRKVVTLPRDPGMYMDLTVPEHQYKNSSKADKFIYFK